MAEFLIPTTAASCLYRPIPLPMAASLCCAGGSFRSQGIVARFSGCDARLTWLQVPLRWLRIAARMLYHLDDESNSGPGLTSRLGSLWMTRGSIRCGDYLQRAGAASEQAELLNRSACSVIL